LGQDFWFKRRRQSIWCEGLSGTNLKEIGHESYMPKSYKGKCTMRKALLAAILFTAAVFCASGEKTETIKDLMWGDRIDGLALTVEPVSREWKVGDEILVRVIIKNFSDKRMETMYFGGRDEKIRLELFDDDGRPVQKTDEGRKAYESAFVKPDSENPGSINVAILDPGGEFSSSIILNRHFEVKKPGTYYLIVMRGQWNWDQGFLVSNMAHFRVVKK
jgi:hypothetical protein